MVPEVSEVWRINNLSCTELSQVLNLSRTFSYNESVWLRMPCGGDKADGESLRHDTRIPLGSPKYPSKSIDSASMDATTLYMFGSSKPFI